jgi:hypothetical protein
LLPDFIAKYNPADARFIGSSIDYLIFRNVSKGKDSEDPIEIVLLDVKTGNAGLNPIQKKIEAAAAVEEDLMAVGAGEARLPPTVNEARKLGPGDAAGILALYSNHGPTREKSERHARWAERHVVYGVVRNGGLVSVAGTWAQTEEGWIIGGVYTSPSYRGKGYATMATHAVT